ncbi:MAG TPA: histidine kinase [Pyrinomonadaceae bacterium]|nr:histidine kinase [Pyrinomonadaceae bacterium]
MNSITERIGSFWPFQIGGWTAYGIVLFLSTIPFASERATIAYRATLSVTCFGGTFILRLVCRRHWRKGFQFPQSLLIVLIWCSILTCLCAALAIKAEYVWGIQLRPFNILLGLTAVTNAGFIFLSWSALYFGIKYYQTVEAERRRVLAAEKLARESELRALRYQIHPHFLFNTLNAISTLVVEGHTEAASSMISRLADFFRATLEGPTANEVGLEDELFLTKQYLEIEKLRLGDRLHVEIEVDPALFSCSVPHLVLQPLVENSIRHGIAPRRGAGTLTIVAGKDHETLVVTVADDGLGKPSRSGSENGDHIGIGLKNINQRLRELYGDSGGLELIWPQAGGCQAILKIPFHEERDPSSNRQ